MDCTLRLAQIDTTLGNLAKNLDHHLDEVRQARAAGVDVLVFPELSLTGYFLKDQTADVAQPRDGAEIRALAAESHDISIAVGFVERGRDGRVYNAVAFLEDGEVRHVHHKVHLVDYGMFEESRDLAAGETFQVVESKHGRFGILTCEDMWHSGGEYLYFLDGADALIVCSASPGRGITSGPDKSVERGLGSVRAWGTLQDAVAIRTRTYNLYVNRIGWEDGISFGGGTRAVDPFGNEVEALQGLDPGAIDVRLSSRELLRARTQTPLRRGEKPWLMARELARRAGLPIPTWAGPDPTEAP